MRWLALTAVLLTGCSVIGLDEFERCDALGDTPDMQEARCAMALNAELGLPESCRPFRCVDGACIREEGIELCDGFDNDCDSVVDEEVFSVGGFTSVDYAETVGRISIATGELVEAFWTEQGMRSFGVAGASLGVGGIDPASTSYEFFRNENSGTNDSLPADAPLVEGCYRRVEVEGVVSFTPETTDCDVLALEASRQGSATLVASLDGNACNSGKLRLGFIDAAGQIAQPGPAARSNSFMGVALTPDGRCSSARPLSCQAALSDEVTGGPCTTGAECGESECVCGRCMSPRTAALARRCGFADFALDTVPADVEGVALHGVVAALSGSYAYTRGCTLEDLPATVEDESLRDVVLFGAYLEEKQDLAAVNATGDGTPYLLTPQTRSTGAPAVVGIGRSFVVAYPNPTQGLAVHFVGTLPDVPRTDWTRCEVAPGGEQDCSDGTQPSVCEVTECGSDQGVCQSGTPTCSSGEPVCLGLRGPDAVEGCGNELDDDCDGFVDEEICVLDRASLAEIETCNGADDDFDGLVDEDALGSFDAEDRLSNPVVAGEFRVGDACGESDGACEIGTVVCQGGVLLCEGGVNPRTNSLGIMEDLAGNGVDDDCDGTVDNAPSGPCVSQIDTCDGRDNDCDGNIDEELVVAGNDTGVPAATRSLATIRQCAPTPPLVDVAGDSANGFSAPFDDVVLSVGTRNDDGLVLGLAYRELEAGGLSHVAFRMLTVHADCVCRGGGSCEGISCEEVLTPTAVRSLSEPARLTSSLGSYGAPSLAYAEDGFRAGVGEATGGWHVTWTGRAESGVRRLMAQRVAMEDGLPIEAAPYGAGVPGAPGSAGSVRAFRDDGGAGYVFVDEGARQIVSARFMCGL